MLGPDFIEKLRSLVGLKNPIAREFLAEFLGTFILIVSFSLILVFFLYLPDEMVDLISINNQIYP